MAEFKPIRQSAVRDRLAAGLALVQGSASDPDAAADLGWSKGTVANVRNRTNTLSVELMLEAAQRTDGRFLAPLMELIAFRLCRIGADSAPDRAMPRMLTAALLKLTAAVENDDEIKDDELRDAADEIFEGGRIFDTLRDRLAALGVGGEQP